MERPGAVVLCGGRSRRMGRPKEWLPIGGETLLQRVVRLVSGRCPIVVVSAAAGQALPPLPSSVEVVADPTPDLGPLQGLAAGLAALEGRVEWAYATASDAPFLEPRWIDRLLDLADRSCDLVLPVAGGRGQPLAALYRPEAAAPAARTLLAAGHRALGPIRDAVRTRVALPDDLVDVDPEFRTLINLNRPEDYDAAFRSETAGDVNPGSR